MRAVIHPSVVPGRSFGDETGSKLRFPLFQPAFDTYTSFYENDWLSAADESAPHLGTRWSTSTGVTADLGIDESMDGNPSRRTGRVWRGAGSGQMTIGER